MRNTPITLVIFSILVSTIASCSNTTSTTNLNTWIGKYSYDEEPIKAIAGYSMTMAWTLSIDKKNDSCQGILEVNGQQTYFKLLADISGDRDSIALTYNKLIDGAGENLKRGDTLFCLLKIGNEIKTKWVSLEPRLADNPPKECKCFNITKK
jgi:hypothetical protein